MEAIDVLNGIYKIYDSEGYLIKVDICTVSIPRKHWWNVFHPINRELLKITDSKEQKKIQKT